MTSQATSPDGSTYGFINQKDLLSHYDLTMAATASRPRCVDTSCRNTVQSGLFMHSVRKPTVQLLLESGGINVQSEQVSKICASTRFSHLISACVHDGTSLNTTVTTAFLDGIGVDANFNG